MKNLIIVSGHCGTTLKAAKMLSEKIGGADIFDTLGNPPKLDFSVYDNYIFGCNMHMFMLNGRFKKWAGELKKYYSAKNVYGYLIGGMEQNGKALARFSKKLPNNKCAVYAWGELVEGAAAGNNASMYKSMKEDCIQKGKEQPHIREEELEKLASIILKK